MVSIIPERNIIPVWPFGGGSTWCYQPNRSTLLLSKLTFQPKHEPKRLVLSRKTNNGLFSKRLPISNKSSLVDSDVEIKRGLYSRSERGMSRPTHPLATEKEKFAQHWFQVVHTSDRSRSRSSRSSRCWPAVMIYCAGSVQYRSNPRNVS